MIGEIVGINKTEFKGQDGLVKNTRFAVVVETEEMTEGRDVDSISWQELENGPAPDLKIGQKYKVRYNKKGKLLFDTTNGKT